LYCRVIVDVNYSNRIIISSNGSDKHCNQIWFLNWYLLFCSGTWSPSAVCSIRRCSCSGD
jgi:hypothetical protein